MKLIPRLNELAKELREEVEYINWGGCCVVATLMHEKLKPLLGKNHLRIEFALSDYGDNDNLNDKLRLWKLNTSNHTNHNLNDATEHGCNHAYIVFKYQGNMYYFDTDEGVQPYEEMKNRLTYRYGDIRVRIGYAIAKSMASSPEGWNNMFNRIDIPVLEDRIAQKQLAA